MWDQSELENINNTLKTLHNFANEFWGQQWAAWGWAGSRCKLRSEEEVLQTWWAEHSNLNGVCDRNQKFAERKFGVHDQGTTFLFSCNRHAMQGFKVRDFDKMSFSACFFDQLSRFGVKPVKVVRIYELDHWFWMMSHFLRNQVTLLLMKVIFRIFFPAFFWIFFVVDSSSLLNITSSRNSKSIESWCFLELRGWSFEATPYRWAKEKTVSLCTRHQFLSSLSRGKLAHPYFAMLIMSN